MKRIINIVNENLKTVVNSVNSYCDDTRTDLEKVEQSIKEHSERAIKYKDSIKEIDKIINKVESEIKDLQEDLSELNNKFGSKDFSEIVKVGQREINQMIAEKRSFITIKAEEVSQIDEDLKKIKDNLAILNRTREFDKKSLHEGTILLDFYKNRIQEIIDFTVEHPDEIELNAVGEADKIDLENADESLKSDVDDRVFEEIENISADAMNDKDIEEALKNNIDEDDDRTTNIDVSIETEIGELLNSTSKILEQVNLIKESTKDIKDTGFVRTTEEVRKDVEEIKVEETKENTVPEVTDAFNVAPTFTEITPVEVQEENVSEVNTEETTTEENRPTPEENKETVEEVKTEEVINVNPVEEVKEIEITPTTDEKMVDDMKKAGEGSLNANLFTEDEMKKLESLFNGIDLEDEVVNVEESAQAVIVEEKKDDEAVTLDNIPDADWDKDKANVDEETHNIDFATSDFETEFKSLDLKADDFNDNFEEFKLHFNKANVQGHLDTLAKHHINKNKIYTSTHIVNNMTYQNVDIMLSLLERKFSEATIQYAYDYLDKINMSKLESTINSGEDKELAEVLYEAIIDDKKEVIGELLELDKKEVKTLKSAAKGTLYRIMNSFPEIVKANYYTLKSYNVDELNDCFTKYPERFIYNPDKFAAILDKYDPEDLVRCVNKNPAVINKL